MIYIHNILKVCRAYICKGGLYTSFIRADLMLRREGGVLTYAALEIKNVT